MKRFVSILILATMTLHCASRLGIISYLYEQRHELAYRAGIIAEIPIAICSGDYFAKDVTLAIHEAHRDDAQQVPGQIPTAKEINLFAQVINPLLRLGDSGVALSHSTDVVNFRYTQPAIGIFHPPC